MMYVSLILFTTILKLVECIRTPKLNDKEFNRDPLLSITLEVIRDFYTSR